jgi:hypothetical protein
MQKHSWKKMTGLTISGKVVSPSFLYSQVVTSGITTFDTHSDLPQHEQLLYDPTAESTMVMRLPVPMMASFVRMPFHLLLSVPQPALWTRVETKKLAIHRLKITNNHMCLHPKPP